MVARRFCDLCGSDITKFHLWPVAVINYKGLVLRIDKHPSKSAIHDVCEKCFIETLVKGGLTISDWNKEGPE